MAGARLGPRHHLFGRADGNTFLNVVARALRVHLFGWGDGNTFLIVVARALRAWVRPAGRPAGAQPLRATQRVALAAPPGQPPGSPAGQRRGGNKPKLTVRPVASRTRLCGRDHFDGRNVVGFGGCREIPSGPAPGRCQTPLRCPFYEATSVPKFPKVP